ncbi:CaiB/BaiF CoA transferase family protein [Novosphingobium pentaromativorans]|uniref:Putative isomerase n=1 Tax=Novosphingobium pentaromativorans US6-1 TaxID=1088721 RepID=G6E7Z0_9SPHN|nr:CoA transferase [Novosphingobium pentaromativorans]AIT81492.1 formyl-CoA transferase [Novosphingobium pentaromativorans US6-1]EHJ62633.1 putative isomerase [Novosphingobium pentaromativorans US6-1]
MAALQGIRVLDFGRYVAGPYCAMMLADFGADVIRIERPGGGDDRAITPITESGEGAVFLQGNRNKRSLALDPRGEEGRSVLARLVASADVVIANVPDSVLPKMGLDYKSLSAIKPDIILCNLSSFGPQGPWADRPGFDSVGQALCGSSYLTGTGEIPFRSPITWVDNGTAVFAAFGVMVALFERERSGMGQQVTGSLLATALAFSGSYLVEENATGVGRGPIGNRGHLNGPTDTFRTSDGWIVTQIVGPGIFKRWTQLMEEPEWLEDPRFATDQLRGENGAILSERMARWCAGRTTQDALATLAELSIPAGPVLSPRQALDHPQVAASNMLVPIQMHDMAAPAALVGPAVGLSETPGSIRTPPPRAGEHSREILREAGLGDEEIDRLIAEGLVSEAVSSGA